MNDYLQKQTEYGWEFFCFALGDGEAVENVYSSIKTEANFMIFETQRIILSPWHEDDAKELIEW